MAREQENGIIQRMARKKKTNLDERYLLYVTLAVFVGIGVGYIYGAFMVPQQQQGFTEQVLMEGGTTPPPEDTVDDEHPNEIEISVDDDPALGPPQEEAAIVMIEFSDYQCPFCKEFYDESFHQLREEYIDTGMVHYVFRDFPLDSHEQAIPAAIAANCAGEQDKYWEIHDMLFERQDEWTYQNNTEQIFEEYAAELGLDLEAFRTCRESGEQKDEILNDLSQGSQYTTQYTPTFYINGEKLVGAQPLETFRTVIEREIAAEQQLLER